MLRSLVFTILLELPEFRALESSDGSRIVTDAVLRIEQDQTKNPSLTIARIMDQYIHDVSDGTEPGVWQRYADALKAGDGRLRAWSSANR